MSEIPKNMICIVAAWQPSGSTDAFILIDRSACLDWLQGIEPADQSMDSRTRFGIITGTETSRALWMEFPLLFPIKSFDLSGLAVRTAAENKSKNT